MKNDRNQILTHHRTLLRDYMGQKGFSCLMFLNPGYGNWDLWIPDAAVRGRDTGPVLPPFNRNSLFLVSRDGTVTQRSALPPHPTDPHQFAVLDCAADAEILGDGPIGAVNLSALKEETRKSLTADGVERKLIDISADMDRLKAVKDSDELLLAERAAQIFDRAFSSVPMFLQSGNTEYYAAVNIRERFAGLGVVTEDLNALTAMELTSAPDGENALTCRFEYPGRRFADGDRVNVLINGYGMPDFACAMGRCYTLGPASQETRENWALAVAAQDAAAAEALPGSTIRRIREVIGERFARPNGLLPDDSNFIYGLGCYRCEAPRSVDDTEDMPLEAGMVLAIGPKILPPGKDPYCCMDPFVVTEHGGERLSGTARDLREL